jgi:hypothetical protein
MSVAEVLKQIRVMSREERDQLLAEIQSMQAQSEPTRTEGHWGQNLLRLLNEMPPIELAHPEIEDAVEWVQTMRIEARHRRFGDLNENTEAE